MPISQENRLLAIATALDENVLAIRSALIHERIGGLFQFEVELSSEDGEIDLDKVMGQNTTIRLNVRPQETRYFNGFVSRFVQVANQGGYAHYRATIVPWLWFLTRTSDCRIFQDRTALDIIEEVFKGHGFSDYKLNISDTYQPKEYCVQYRETDFNFVSRLMEQEGIYYYFKHENGKHTLVLADSISAHSPIEGFEEVTFHEVEMQQGASGREVVTKWTVEKEVQPVAFALNDFDFTKPKTDLLASTNVTRDYGAAHFEMYDYPGDYAAHDEGTRLVDVRIEELQSQYEVLHGQANARGLAAGATFTLKSHPRKDQNREYLITQTTLQVDAGEFASTPGGARSVEFFSCSFTAIDNKQQFRPARLTPKPIVQGPQTAIVVGPSGEEIYTDKYGRVKVKFHWDRYSKADENSSCWVRVAQSVAGKHWGAIHTPRIGQEVIVEFLEGDPDRPIITGRVYNATAMPPYPMPDHKTMSAFKSNSSKGGEGFNELRFEDKKGDEQIFLHGEKNLDIRIKKDRFETIENDRHLLVKMDKFEHVENNRDEIVDADHKEKIGKDRHLKVVGKEAKEVGGSLSLTVKGEVIEVFKANHSEQTTSDYYLKADNVVIEGMTNVTIKVGQSYIAIESSGIKIGATQIEIEGQATIDAKSPMTTVKGDGQLTLKGGMVMIN
jgi:type VI secretion system secreted protein VgrG